MSMYGKSYKGVTTGKGKTKQSLAESADINTIVARYQRTGFLEHQRAHPGIFADVSKLPDFQGMVSQIRTAQEAFDTLPSALRSRFLNDPGRLIDFVADPANFDEAVKLGILEVRVPKEPLKPEGGGDPPKVPKEPPGAGRSADAKAVKKEDPPGSA